MKKAMEASQIRLTKKVAKLEAEVAELTETLRAIRNDEVDALVVAGEHGEQIYTLQSADHPYRVLVETMSEGAATLGHDGTIFYCNQKFSKMLQTSLDSLIGASFYSFIIAEEKAEFTALFERGKRLGGQEHPFAQMRAPCARPHLSFDERRGYRRRTRRLPDRDRSHRTSPPTFEESRADVERLNIEKDLRERFVSTLSHDLRNPLAAAKINTQMILRHAEGDEKSVLLGSKVLKNIDRADMMIQNLLDANRVRAGELLPLEVTRCDLQLIIHEVLEDLMAIHGDRFVYLPAAPVMGLWSAGQLRRLVENLANNAIKYGSLDTPVTVKLDAADQKVTLSVHNLGSYLAPKGGIFKPTPRRREPSRAATHWR